jgi:integrase
MLMLYAGLRRGEALALRWEDIDGDVIHVKQGVHFEDNAPVTGAPKTPAAVRDVPLFAPIREALATVPRTCAFVCTGAEGKPVTSSAWARGWVAFNHAMERAAGQPFSVRAHDLRHTFASMLYDAGVDIKTAQKLLGHASPEITMQIYTHLSDAREASSIGKMEAYLSGMGHEMGHKSPENPVK